MYYRNEQSNQQEQPQFQEYNDIQCPWADNCPYLQANNDSELRQYQPHQRPRPHYPMPQHPMPYHPMPYHPMPYHPYYPPYFNPYHHPYYHPYYPQYQHHPYEHYYQPHNEYEHDHELGRDE